MSQSIGEERADQSAFATPARGDDENDISSASTDDFLTPRNLIQKSTSSKWKNDRRQQKQKRLKDDERSPDPLYLARHTNTALTRKRAERERMVYATKEPRTVIIGFLDRLIGLREPAHVPVSGLAVALQDLVRVRHCGWSSQTLLHQQQQQQMSVIPESPKSSPETLKWSSMPFGAPSSPLMTKTTDDTFIQQLGGSSSAKNIQLLYNRQNDFCQPLDEMNTYSQRMGGYRYEKMNCDLGFRFDHPIPLKSANMFNSNAQRSNCLSQSSSSKMTMPFRHDYIGEAGILGRVLREVMSWKQYLAEQLGEWLIYAAKNPGEFVFYVLLILSPLFALSAYLSWKLSKAIQKENKDKKRKEKLHNNLAKTRHRKHE
uniref:Small integral membrane protein 15 n=1 Tax=Plectus sambesii TaxID=2011161 RepID=A0A914UJ43_9BILA